MRTSSEINVKGDSSKRQWSDVSKYAERDGLEIIKSGINSFSLSNPPAGGFFYLLHLFISLRLSMI